MKTTIKLLLISILILNISCTDWLDIRPENEIVLEDFWQTESQATAVLSSCYRGMLLDAYLERMIVWGEIRSDNVVQGNSIRLDLQRILDVNITPTNTYANWGAFYSVINYCNTFLHFAPGVLERDQNFTLTKLHTYEAEALTIRALSYFYLVRAFREVPLILEPTVSDSQDFNIAKSSEREILDQIIADLTKALQFARADYGKGTYNKGRITLNAVRAILADVYLWDQQYDKCVEMCDKIIADPKLELVSSDKLLTSVFFSGNSTESIFELQYNKDVQHNNTVNNFYGYENRQFGEFSFPAYLAKNGQFSPFNYAASAVKESTKDLREKLFIGAVDMGDGYPIYKYALAQNIENADETFSPKYRPASTTVNWVVYRLADILLMRAEALVQLNRNQGDLEEALRMVNKTYLRSNTTADSLQFVTYNNQSDMEKLVLRERQRELMFEGKRWFDLMRLVRRYNDPTVMLAYVSPKLTGDNMQIRKMSVIDGLYFPILKSELEMNPKLTQNPFYENSEFMK